MRGIDRSTVATTLGALIAALVVVAVPGTASAALPGTCNSTWNGSVSSDWMNGANWSPTGVPNGAAAVACIPAVGLTPVLNATVTVKAVHLDLNADLAVQAGGRLFANGPDVSQWAANTLVDVSGGRLGGTGIIEAHGEVDFSAGSVLTSINAGGGASSGSSGSLKVMSDGEMRVDDGLAIYTRYQVFIYGTATLGNDSFIAADWGTVYDIASAGAQMHIEGDGGYYQGFPVAGQPLSFFGVHGLLAKDQGSGTSVIDAAYAQAPSAVIKVNCCGTLALPDATAVGAQVVQGMAFATAACGAGATSVCQGSVNPAVDPMSVSLMIPGANPQASGVALQERGTPTDRRLQDDRQRGVRPRRPADAQRGQSGDPDPALLAGRRDEHTAGGGPGCAHRRRRPPDPDPGLHQRDPARRVRVVHRAAGGAHQPEHHRHRAHDPDLPLAPAPQQARRARRPDGAVGAPGRIGQARRPFDGSVVRLAWSPPANDGGAAVTSYRVYLDNKLVATTGGTTVDVKNAGKGTHTLAVSAVNLLGEGVRASSPITLAPLSKPRKVKDLRGSKGGKLTAGVKWKAPAASGGLEISGYQVVVVKKNGVKVKLSKKGRVGASVHKLIVKLPKGKYRFKVRARNGDGAGPWSKWTDLVRPR